MSAPMFAGTCNKFFGKFNKIYEGCNICVRYASKKASGSTRNKKGPTKSKKRGPKVYENEKVHQGEILFRQLGLKCYPGENVGLGHDQTLIALKDGRVVTSYEQLSPYSHSPLYPAVQAGRVLYRKFFHVIAENKPGVFRLVSQT